MRGIALGACALFLAISGLDTAAAQPASAPPLALPSSTVGPRIEWEVKNRFRLFKNEADFQRHVAASHGDGVLAAEGRLERGSEGRGWAQDMLDNLCVDQTGRIPEFCQRDGAREVYLAPEDHRVQVTLAGDVPPGSACVWQFDDSDGAPQATAVPCQEGVRLRVRYGRTTVATATITLPNGTTQSSTANIQVQDFLIAGMGDSIAAGEGNPDRPVALDDGGFCFRRFILGGLSEYFRPGRTGFRGSRACDPALATPGGGNTAADWAKLNARWLNAACHRSLYGYQMRTALALAVENPKIAVTYLPLGCTGATIDVGFFNSQRARECPPTGSCAGTAPAQMDRLKEALALARRHRADRALDLVLLTIGANDVSFSWLVADVIVESALERTLFEQGGMIIGVPEAQKALDKDVPPDFAKLRAALKPLVGGNLAKVVFVNYGNPILAAPGKVCPGGRLGFDVHPAFNADPVRLRKIADFVSQKFLPKMKTLARCDGTGTCRDPATERMTFVDSHQAAFASHGFCAQAEGDPEFDRACFSAEGNSFQSDPAGAANDPMACQFGASAFRPYASRARWIRTANDSYFTAMTFPEGLPAVMRPSDLHDATWAAASAVYGGAIHPTAEGHAAMADAALPAVRDVLGLRAPPQIRAEPLAPLLPQLGGQSIAQPPSSTPPEAR
ncbi:MAG: hypothetical protein HY659_07405 [Rhizobiales bacterium]|nr:hypothetical protein [Hyphomicrobiales bacterium]